MNKKGRLYYTCGLPRSGKSSFAKKWHKYHVDTLTDEEMYLESTDKRLRTRVVVSGDEIRGLIHGTPFRIESEPMVFCYIDMFARMLINTGYDVLIDETCTTEQTLLRYLRIDIDATPIFFDATEEECIKRAIDTGKPFLIPPIKRMAKQFKNIRKNWDETVTRLKSYLEERKMHDLAV